MHQTPNFSTSVDHPDTASFPRFPDIPREIRLQIWELSIPGPRVVHLRQRLLKNQDHVVELDKENWGYKADVVPPGMLFACRESHEIASKIYSKTFACRNKHSTSIPEVYFDYNRDVLYLSQQETFKTRNGRKIGNQDIHWATYLADGLGATPIVEAGKVLSLAICLDFSGTQQNHDSEHWIKEILHIFPGLENLVLLPDMYTWHPDEPPPISRNLDDVSFVNKKNNVRRPYDILGLIGATNLQILADDESSQSTESPIISLGSIQLDLAGDRTYDDTWDNPRLYRKRYVTSLVEDTMIEMEHRYKMAWEAGK